MRHAMDWWPMIWMSAVYVAAWAAIIWVAVKALGDRRGRGQR
jgi:hypothetical protein